MRNLIIVLFVCLSGFISSADEYRYSVNLKKVQEDKITVTLTPPDISQNEIDFLFPAIVPGTYEVYDFGRFISKFRAIGKNGVAIKVKKINVNTYRLSPASAIEKIMYEVDDTFDKCGLSGSKGKIIFEPAGSNFEVDRNFCINTHSMFGYFKGMGKKTFVLEFEKPKGFYPATGLTDLVVGENIDKITADDYHHLADSPIMYFLPDTTTIKVADTKVLVACYAPNKKISSRFIAETLSELLEAQKNYLGGTLPVEKYAFLFYFTDKPTLSGSSGALEHSFSSFYVMPEFDSLALQQQLRDVSAHEFFHIVTPLNIHSYEIGDFDFNAPKMSQHLWLYEGMTEYAAHHAQVKAGIIGLEEFLNSMMGKYRSSLENYNDTMSFTFMSRNILNEKIHKQFGNVYEKGAIVGMCLDILLRDLSQGMYGTQNLMHDLSLKYGKNKSFKDEELFDEIEKLTYPEIGTFLRLHVAGKTPLPIQKVFAKVGIEFVKEKEVEEFSLGNPDLNYNPKTGRIFVEGTKEIDAFGKSLGYKRGDELYRLNGSELKLELIKEVISEYYNSIREGDKITIEVYRPKFGKGKYKLVTLSATANKVKHIRTNQISLIQDMTEQQALTMKSWLGL
jgi:predicted metalloprotease with PDZ domain